MVGYCTWRQNRRTEDVLNAIFALPSDNESVDSLDESDDDTCEAKEDKAVAKSSSFNDDYDDDDEVLFQLADIHPQSDVVSEPADTSIEDDGASRDTVSYDIESDWDTDPINESDVDFNSINVIHREPFFGTNGPCEFFDRMFPEDIVKLLVEQTNLHAMQNRTRHWQDTDAIEIRAFMGVLIAAGLHSLPEIRMCWSTDSLFRIQPVADVMSRSRFMKLLGNLHVADNSQAPGRQNPYFDKLYKFRTLLTCMNEKCANYVCKILH